MTRARAQLLRAASTRALASRCPCLALLLLCIVPRLAYAAALEIGPVPGIVGSRFEYVVRKGDTLTAVSARYAVSEKALIRDNGLRAPYRLKPGDRLQVHDRHLVPGDPPADGIVINLPQRVLFVFRGGALAGAYPVAAGKPTWKTPTGSYAIRTMEQDKPWIVPPSIQAEMRAEGKPVLTRVEPGPDNPLGRYWLGLTLAGYGIHGTNAPSSIYYLRTHGCIRVHPDDMEKLYGQVMLHMPVRIIYAHTLIARLADGRIVAEVNPDFYSRGGDPLQLLRDMAHKENLEAAIDWAAAAEWRKRASGRLTKSGAPTPYRAWRRAATGNETDRGAHGRLDHGLRRRGTIDGNEDDGMKDRQRQPDLRRRGFVRRTAVLALGALAARPALANISSAQAGERALSFYNTHTGETLKAVYWAQGQYVPDSLSEINRILRDHYSGDVTAMAPQLLDLAHALRRALGTDAPVHIISGYRSPQTNAMLAARSGGVARHSMHLEGAAIDLRVPGRDLEDVHRAALALTRRRRRVLRALGLRPHRHRARAALVNGLTPSVGLSLFARRRPSSVPRSGRPHFGSQSSRRTHRARRADRRSQRFPRLLLRDGATRRLSSARCSSRKLK